MRNAVCAQCVRMCERVRSVRGLCERVRRPSLYT
jgi:hypothetical protein